MTAKWPTSSTNVDSTGKDKGSEEDENTDEDAESDLTYNFYYRPELSTKIQTKVTATARKKYKPLMATDTNEIETILPGIEGVRKTCIINSIEKIWQNLIKSVKYRRF